MVDQGDISPSDGITLGAEILRRLGVGRLPSDSGGRRNIRKLHRAMIDMTKQRPGMSADQALALKHEVLLHIHSGLPQNASAQCAGGGGYNAVVGDPADPDDTAYTLRVQEFVNRVMKAEPGHSTLAAFSRELVDAIPGPRQHLVPKPAVLERLRRRESPKQGE